MSVDHSSVTDSYYYHSDFDHDDKMEYCTTLSKITLYGRSEEECNLKAAFDNLSLGESKRMIKVLVHGESGLGKTALVETVRVHAFNSNGLFVMGKYFQNTEVQEPYSAIMAAFSDLCDLVSQSVDYNEDLRREVQKKLGVENIRILRAFISNFAPFLETQENNAYEEFVDIRSGSLFPKFLVACKCFLQAFSFENRVVVFFLDDIQWADEGSKLLISLLLKDRDLRNIMLILSYRDENASDVTDITKFDSGNHNLINIGLRNLQFDDVFKLVTDIFGNVDEHKTISFTNIILAKTIGNPFHVVQFIEFVKQEGFVLFDKKLNAWDFDAEEMKNGVMLSDKIADLLTKKITRLPTEVQECLKIAALVGFSFEKEVILFVLSHMLDQSSRPVDNNNSQFNSERVSKKLVLAIEEGFIDKTRQGYQFTHDKIQGAFQSIIAKSEKNKLHHLIGEAFAAKMEPESDYFAATHLLQAPDYLHQKSNRIKLANLCLNAATYCSVKCAFGVASSLLHEALALIDDTTKWISDHDLSFKITVNLAKFELIIGNHIACSDLVKTALLHAQSNEMIVDCLMIDIECNMAQNNIDGSIIAARNTLSQLGISLPCKISVFHVASKLLKVKLMLRGKSDSDILNLPRMTESAMSISVKVLINMCMYCFMKDEEFLAVYSALLATELTLKHGLNAYAATALTIYGVAELSNGNRKRAYRFGKLALLLQERLQSIPALCPTTAIAHSTLTHWYDPLLESPLRLQKAAIAGLEIGDIVNGAFSFAMSYGIHLVLGTNLQDLKVLMLANDKILRDLSQEAMAMWTHAYVQLVLNLTSHEASDWKELLNLNGEIIDEATYFGHAQDAKHMLLISIGWYAKGMLAFWFGVWSIAEEMFQDIMNKDNSFHFGFGGIQVHFFAGISSYSRYDQTFNKKHLKLARKHKAALMKFKSQEYPLSRAYLSLIEAEDLAAKNASASRAVMVSYKTSIDAFASEGLHHFEALANERAGYYQLKLKSYGEARASFQRAIHLYDHKWGASAKSYWLQEKCDQALGCLVQNERFLVGQSLTIPG
jgi:predicted ATPase